MTKFKTPIIYGTVIAIAGTVLMLSLIAFKLLGPEAVLMETDMAGGTILFLMLYVFLLIGIYFAIKKRKETLGHISFKEGLVQGVTVSLATAAFSVLFTVVFYELLYPTYVNEMLEALRTKMEDMGVPADKLNGKLEEKRAYYSTATQSMFAFIGNLVTGTAFTLLLGFFLKSNTKK